MPMGIAAKRGLGVILIALVVAGGLCVLDHGGAGADLCFLLLAVTPIAVPLVHVVPVNHVVLPARRRRWLLIHAAPPSPI